MACSQHSVCHHCRQQRFECCQKGDGHSRRKHLLYQREGDEDEQGHGTARREWTVRILRIPAATRKFVAGGSGKAD